MKRGLIVAVAVFVVLCPAMYLLMANSHIDIYPCTKTEYDFQLHSCRSPESSTCAILDLDQEGGQACERAALTPAGYAVAFVVIVGGSLALALVAGFLARNKPAKA